MAADFAEKEREFLDSLAGDTGRDLAQWMEAIGASGLQERNAIIDWLRTQGFLFAKASWLERIHHNGGRPIYADLASPRPVPAAPAAVAPAAVEAARDGARPAAAREVGPGNAAERTRLQPVPLKPPATLPSSPSAGSEAAVAAPGPNGTAVPLDALLAEAKAYRPLAQFVLKEIGALMDGLVLEPRQGYVALVRGEEFAALTISPKELRLGLVSAGGTPPGPWGRAKFAKTHPNMPGRLTHMTVLTDARQVTGELLAAVRAAAFKEPFPG